MAKTEKTAAKQETPVTQICFQIIIFVVPTRRLSYARSSRIDVLSSFTRYIYIWRY